MTRDEYKLISTGPGAEVRNLLRAAGSGYGITRRSELEVLLDDAGGTSPAERRVISDGVLELARAARAQGADAFTLNGRADEIALELMQAREAADQLLDDDPDDAPLTGEAAADVADRIRSGYTRRSDEDWTARKADDQERERLAKLGVRPSLSADAIADQILAGG